MPYRFAVDFGTLMLINELPIETHYLLTEEEVKGLNGAKMLIFYKLPFPRENLLCASIIYITTTTIKTRYSIYLGEF